MHDRRRGKETKSKKVSDKIQEDRKASENEG